MKTRIALALATALVLPTLAIAGNMTDKQAAQQTAAATPVKSDAEAVAVLMGVNDHEIRASQMAQKKGVSPAVMDYANMMVKEHGDNQAKIISLAGAQSVTPAETEGVKALKAKKQTMRDELSLLEPAKFEAAFLKAMVKDHTEVLAKLDKELIPAAKNAAVAQHLRDTRMHVAMHLEKAKSLAGDKNVNLDQE